jgi:hypothetical protein
MQCQLSPAPDIPPTLAWAATCRVEMWRGGCKAEHILYLIGPE